MRGCGSEYRCNYGQRLREACSPVVRRQSTLHRVSSRDRSTLQCHRELTLYAKPDDCESSTCSYKIIGPPHAEDRPRDDWISYMVHAGAARVEKHGDRADQLGEEDGNDGLPPIQPYTNHSASKRPIPKGKSPIEHYKVPPPPGSLLRRGGIEILIRPCWTRRTVAMLVKCCVVYLGPILECLPAGKGPGCILFLLSRPQLESLDFGGHRVPSSSIRHFRGICGRVRGSSKSAKNSCDRFTTGQDG